MSAFPHQGEIELKIRFESYDQMKALQSNEDFVHPYQPGPMRSLEVVDLYWDTPDYALLRGGFGLRTRLQDSKWLVTLKSLGYINASGVAKRIELETAADDLVRALLVCEQRRLCDLLAPLAEKGWPPADWGHVVLHERNPPVRFYVLLHQRRDKQTLRADGGEPIAEASFDTVRIFAPLAVSLSNLGQHEPMPTYDHQPVDVWYELEVEADRNADAAQWDELVGRLMRTHPLQPADTGKVEMALRLLARLPTGQCAGPAQIQAEMPMSEAGRLIWKIQLTEVLLNEAGVRRDRDEEAVHDLRVAIRRMRAAERVFGDFFVKSAIKPLRNQLRTTARSLGPARDLDVSLSRLQAYRTTHSSEAEADDGLDQLAARWQAQQDTAYETAIAWLASDEYSQLVMDLDAFCQTPGAGARKTARTKRIRPQQVRHVMPAQILARYATMRAYESVLDPQTPVATLHALRVEGKRLRYCLEFVQHLLEPDAAAFLVDRLKAIQDMLGAINDAAFTRRQLQMAATQGLDSPSLQQYRRHQEQIIEHNRTAFAPLWTEFTSMEMRRQLAIAVVAL